jgi:hypothetical protein
MGAIREVRKRDGRVVPFDEAKIADAIYKAIRSVGKGDRSLAEELASAATHFLSERCAGTIPGIEDIQDQIETVLIEMGHSEIAKAYILYRNKRATVRETLQVRKAPPEGVSGGPELVEDRSGVSAWSKSKIAAALIREADMDVGVAEEIASAVERKVFSSGIRRISTSLIRELVDNELFERGFAAKLFRQAPIGLPKYNLEQIIFGTDTKEGFTFPKTPVEVRDIIAERILEGYSLDEVVSRAVADAHRDGRIHLHRLGDPVRFAGLTWDLSAPCPRASGMESGGLRQAVLHLEGLNLDGRLGAESSDPLALEADEGLLDPPGFFRDLSRLVRFVAGEIRLRRPGRLLAGDGDVSGEVEAIHARLQEIQAGPPRSSIALELDLDRSALPWLEALSDRPTGQGPALYLRFSGTPFPDRMRRRILEIAAALFERGETVEFLPGKMAWAETMLSERGQAGILPVAPAISINLPRAAFRSAGNPAGRIERELEEVLDIAIKGHLERRRFLERLGANPETPLWEVLGRPGRGGQPLASLADFGFPIEILGLNECVKFLTGFELYQDPKAKTAARGIVETIARKVRRESRGLGLRLLVRESRNAGSLRRLEEIDGRRYPEESAEVERGRRCDRAEGGCREGLGDRTGLPRYSDGVRLHRLAPVDPLRRLEHLAGFLDCVDPVGAVEESPDLRSGGRDLVLSLLEDSLPYLAGPRTGLPVAGPSIPGSSVGGPIGGRTLDAAESSGTMSG